MFFDNFGMFGCSVQVLCMIRLILMLLVEVVQSVWIIDLFSSVFILVMMCVGWFLWVICFLLWMVWMIFFCSEKGVSYRCVRLCGLVRLVRWMKILLILVVSFWLEVSRLKLVQNLVVLGWQLLVFRCVQKCRFWLLLWWIIRVSLVCVFRLIMLQIICVLVCFSLMVQLMLVFLLKCVISFMIIVIFLLCWVVQIRVFIRFEFMLVWQMVCLMVSMCGLWVVVWMKLIIGWKDWKGWCSSMFFLFSVVKMFLLVSCGGSVGEKGGKCNFGWFIRLMILFRCIMFIGFCMVYR